MEDAGLAARYELHMTEPAFNERFESPSDYGMDDSFGSDGTGSMQTAVASGLEPASDQTPDQGPCLYLGPAGQRCYRRAVRDGFCALHLPGAAAIRKVGKPAKWLAAIAGMLGVLWPYIYDFLHALFRIFHPR